MEEITYNGLFTLQWHITHRCNLRCSHCYQDDYSAFESRDSLTEVLRQYNQLLTACGYKGYLNITGGEPLTHPDLFWLLDEAKKLGITTAVLTNGTLIGRHEAKKLKACGVDYVQVSIDGTEKAHDRIRGKGSFIQAVGGLRELIAQGIYTDVSFTAQRENKAELKKLARFCADIGVDKLWFDRVVIPLSDDKNKLSLTKDEFHKLSKQAARLNKKHMVSCARALQFIPCKTKNIYQCTAGKTLLAVLADGSVMPCRRLPIAVGNVKNNSLLEIYTDSKELVKLRKTGIPETCKKCEYAEQCRGGARCVTNAKTGRYDLPDPDCPIINKYTPA